MRKHNSLHPDVTISGVCNGCNITFELIKSWDNAIKSNEHNIPEGWEIIDNKEYCSTCKGKVNAT